ncbi:MAG: PD40 domain-containing protein [Ignavibacteriaceae bacterium]|nr:PD40 domain-containing protein [Ignavibacteriaceae bacterium]
MKTTYTIILVFLVANLSALAQFTEFHPELDWYTIKGKHCEVHFHSGAERTAKVVAKIADEIWEPITSLYQYQPDVTHFVIKDIDDYSNGATYFFDNKIEIWTSALDFDLRGAHNWLRNVISHEFTHLVQIQASMKSTRSLPAVFFKVLNYEDERRPDILYGFPNFIVSYPFATINMPAWFAEGTAQYMRKEFDYDNWDTHRDMILRSYALDGNLLTWNEMGVFGKTSLGNESVYNSGFALTRYISQKYGEAKLREVTKALGKMGNFTIDAAFQDVIGKNGNELYSEWKNFITEDYKKRTELIRSNTISGEVIASEGFGNFYPIFSKDGNKILYNSNKSSDYFSPSSIHLYDLQTKKEKLIASGVHSTLAWIDEEKKIIYSKLSDDNPNLYNVHDLYIYDIIEEDEERLTYNLRANQPAVSPDETKIVFIFQKDGTTNLGTVDITGKNFKQLTYFNNGEQIYNPKFSNDGSFIIFDYSYHHTRDIYKIDSDGGTPAPVISTKYDERNPCFDKNGYLIYSSDETGIYNLYSMDLLSQTKKQITNVLGGAFMPAVDENGNVVYTGYTSTGYKIFYLPKTELQKVKQDFKYELKNNPPLTIDNPNGDINNFAISRLTNFNDFDTPDYSEEKYSGVFSKLTFFPFLRYDNYNTSNKFIEKLKPGLYVSSNDMLNRYSIFAGASLNTRLERDLFLIFEYKNKLPLLFSLGLKPEMSLELYNISRKANTSIIFDELDETFNTRTDVTYNLFEVDIAAKHRFITRNQHLEFRFIFSRYSAELAGFVIPQNNTLYPTTNDVYLIGRNFQLKYNIEQLFPHKDADINPIGFEAELQYNYELNKFNDEGNYEYVDGIFKPRYNNYNFHKLELNSKLHLPLWAKHTITAQIRAGSIFGPQMPDFFDFYLGGLIGMKAYPFYAISGNEVAWLNLTYRFPLFTNIDSRIGHLYVDKVFLSFYGDLGNAWNGNIPSIETFKKGVGAEIRIQLNSFYLFPTSIFFNGSYGFDEFERKVRDEMVTYGKEWRFYGGILFGFDF